MTPTGMKSRRAQVEAPRLQSRKSEKNSGDRRWLMVLHLEEGREILIELVLGSFNGPRTPILDRNRGRGRLRSGVFLLIIFFFNGLSGLCELVLGPIGPDYHILPP